MLCPFRHGTELCNLVDCMVGGCQEQRRNAELRERMICPLFDSSFACTEEECLKHGCQHMSARAPTQAEPKYFNPHVLRFIECDLFKGIDWVPTDERMAALRLEFGPQDLTHRKPVDPIKMAKAEGIAIERNRCIGICKTAYRACDGVGDFQSRDKIGMLLQAIKNPVNK